MQGASNREPFRVVITGGPCAGKTALWRFLCEEFPQGVPVPEAATELILAGKSEDSLGVVDFQLAVFERQWALEEAAQKKGLLLFCDRGLLDGLAYFPGLFSCLDVSQQEAMGRYALVIQLEAIRDSRAYALHCKSNPARHEDHARALSIEREIRRIYEVHPGYVFLAGSLEEKRREALQLLRKRVPVMHSPG